MDSDLRKTGIDVVGDVPWGTHFCNFYRTREDLIDILVPYFKAGLEQNEFCMWVTADPLTADEAKAALREAVPDLDRFLERGQIEIIPHTDWYLKDGFFDCDRVLRGWVERLDAALLRGHEGLRLTGNTFWLEKSDWDDFLRYEDEVNNVIGNYRMLAVCTYSMDRCGASEIMDVVNTHQFALAMREGKWSIVESSEQKRAGKALRESEERYRSLFENMQSGFAYCRMVFEDGRPSDFIYLSVNGMFETLTGLKDVVGKRVSVVIPGIRESDPKLFEIYGRVAKGGEPEKFEMFLEVLKEWFSISVYCPEPEHFVAVFDIVTERKRSEEEVRRRNAILDGINRIFREALACESEEELGRFCLSVAEEVTQSRFGFIGDVGADGLMHDIAISDPGWELCTMYDKTGHRRAPGDFKLHGIYGRVLLDGKAFITNDPSSHPDRIGTPEGHPPLTAFLGAPLIHGGKVIGMIGLGNREGGYRVEQLQDLETLGIAIAQVLVHKRAEEGLRSSEEISRQRLSEIEAIYASAGVGLCFIDTDLRFVRVNERFAEINGAYVEDHVGRTIRDVVPDLAEQAEKLLKQVMESGRPALDIEITGTTPAQPGVARAWIGQWIPMKGPDGRIRGVNIVSEEITARKRMEEALKASVAEKEILLKELAHRTKNNMQVIASLLSLQSATLADRKLIDALSDTQDRIRAMALVHEKLYRTGNFASLDMKAYVQDLLASIIRAHRDDGKSINADLDIEDLSVSIDAALPCGLIINELVSNSLKHAFAGRRAGAIFLSMRRRRERMELRYRDDGPGPPPGLDITHTKSLGMKLVQNLAVRQLRGKMEFRRNPVTEFVFTFDDFARESKT